MGNHLIRLQKLIAEAGVASRRKAESLILAGKVKVNGEVVTALGTRVDPRVDVITVSGKRIAISSPKVYYALNKPLGYLTSLRDPQGRPTIMDLIPDIPVRVFPVGRLDYNSRGLLLLTNDGQLAYCLTHPKFKVGKTYRVLVEGAIGEKAIGQLRSGVELEDGRTAPAQVTLRWRERSQSSLEISVYEGRKREIRRMCQAVGHPVLELERIEFAGIKLGNLPPGSHRPLRQAEIAQLKRLMPTATSPRCSPGTGV